jgi:type IV secretion system protein VirB8
MARESFDIATVSINYRKAALFSAGAARTSYLHTMQASNPGSPLLLPRTTLVETRVKSVSPIGPNAALVRFETVRTDQGARPQAASAWVAVIRYHYSRDPMKLEDRFINPLGFQVTSYHKDPEALPQAAPPSPAATPASSHPVGSTPTPTPVQGTR